MRYIRQLGIILSISFVGELLNRVLPLPIPASIYGLILMFLCLKLGVIPLDAVNETGKFLIEILPLMFIPAAVGLLDAWDILRPVWISVVSITVVSTIAVMAVSGRVAQAVIRRDHRQKEEEVRHD